MIDEELERLVRDFVLDPFNQLRKQQCLNFLERVGRGDFYLDLIESIEQWQAAPEFLLQLTGILLEQRFSTQLDFIELSNHFCAGKKFKVAVFQHKKTKVLLNLIPAGRFLMGSPEEDLEARDTETPQEWVSILRPFLIGQFPVTNKEWERIETTDVNSLYPDLPVVEKSWVDVNSWLLKADGLRLPSEIEWEYACRSGSEPKYFWGEDWDGDYCWFQDNSRGMAHPKLDHYNYSNGFGLIDMLGNINEFCHGPWVEVLSEIGTFSRASDSDLVPIRGGDWCFGAYNCRSAFRRSFSKYTSSNLIGFRVAFDILEDGNSLNKADESQSLIKSVMSFFKKS